MTNSLNSLLSFIALIGGVVVNTCGYIRQEGYESFKHVAKTFDGKLFLSKKKFFFGFSLFNS
jgi:hypothetical protein